MPDGQEPFRVRFDEFTGPFPRSEDRPRVEAWFRRRALWRASMDRAISEGIVSPADAVRLGADERPFGSSRWEPLPERLFHVTTARPSVIRGGLKTRRELMMERGLGLGSGEDDAVSFTTDMRTAEGIGRALHEARLVARNEITPQMMIDQARRGQAAQRPWLQDIVRFYDHRWVPGEPLPTGIQDVIDGRMRAFEFLLRRPDEMPGFEPVGRGFPDALGRPRFVEWTRPMTPPERVDASMQLYKPWAAFREGAGGPLDPLFFLSDPEGLARVDPAEIGILEFRPRSGAMGYRLGALGEWRTRSGRAVRLLMAEMPKAVSVESVLAARIQATTGGQVLRTVARVLRR